MKTLGMVYYSLRLAEQENGRTLKPSDESLEKLKYELAKTIDENYEERAASTKELLPITYNRKNPFTCGIN